MSQFKFVKFVENVKYLPRVTVRGTGQIGFNSGAVNLYNLQEFSHVYLYYDWGNSVVGIEPIIGEREGSIPLYIAKANSFVRAKNFMDRFSIDYKTTKKYKLDKDPTTGFLYFDLQSVLDERCVDEQATGES